MCPEKVPPCVALWSTQKTRNNHQLQNIRCDSSSVRCRLIVGQIMPLLMKMVWHPNAVLPLFQTSTFAVRSQHQRAKKIVALAQVLVPDGKKNRLFVKLVGSRFEGKLLVVHRIQWAPFDGGFVFLVAMWVGFDLAVGQTNQLNYIYIF